MIENDSGRNGNNSSTHPTDRQLESQQPKYTIQDRIGHFTWNWFACTMSTGSIAVVLGQTPNRFTGLTTIGKIFFILDLVLLILFVSLMTTRFIMRPRVAAASLHHPHEGLMFGSFWVSLCLALQCTQIYGVPSSGPWLVTTLKVLYWIYVACAFSVAVFQYATLFIAEKLSTDTAMPAWVFPAYPLLVTGTLAGVIVPSQPRDSVMPMWIAAVMLQGLGWLMAVFMYAIYIQRLMNTSLPPAPRRPAMYISVGPVGYTSAALVTLGMQAPKILPQSFLSTTINVGETIKILGVLSGIFLWAVAFWFFCLSTVAVLQGAKDMKYTTSWWAFIFPNAGMTIALIQISQVLNNSALKGVTSAMSIILVMLWLFVAVACIIAIARKQVLWEGMDEDFGMDLTPLKEKV